MPIVKKFNTTVLELPDVYFDDAIIDYNKYDMFKINISKYNMVHKMPRANNKKIVIELYGENKNEHYTMIIFDYDNLVLKGNKPKAWTLTGDIKWESKEGKPDIDFGENILYVSLCFNKNTINIKEYNHIVVEYINHPKINTIYYITKGAEGQRLKIEIANDKHNECKVNIKYRCGALIYILRMLCSESWVNMIFTDDKWVVTDYSNVKL